MSNKKNKKKLDIKQWHSLLISLYIKSNKIESSLHHVEDIAIENKKRFPAFFCWSKYKDQIDLRQVMRTMDKLKDDNFIIGSNTKMWSLTKKGYDFAEQLSSFDLITDSKTKRGNSDYFAKEISRIISSPCFSKFNNKLESEIENSEVKYLFRIDSYNNTPESITRNKERLFIASNENKEITKFLNSMWNLLIQREIINQKDFKL